MDTVWYIVKIVGMIAVSGVSLLIVIGITWWMFFKEKNEYTRAREEIFGYVRSYKKKCSGNNRFLVNIESLQDAFREYDTETIKKVWLELVKEHLIERDEIDDEWCVR